MPTKNPRVMTVLEPTLIRWLRKNAMKQGTSISQTIRDLVRDAYMEHEDVHWVREAESRLSNFKRNDAVSHRDAWKDKP